MKALGKIPLERKEFSYVLGAISITVDLSQNLYVLKTHTHENVGMVKISSPYNRPRRPTGGGSTLSLTSALDGVRGQRPLYSREKMAVPIA